MKNKINHLLRTYPEVIQSIKYDETNNYFEFIIFNTKFKIKINNHNDTMAVLSILEENIPNIKVANEVKSKLPNTYKAYFEPDSLADVTFFREMYIEPNNIHAEIEGLFYVNDDLKTLDIDLNITLKYKQKLNPTKKFDNFNGLHLCVETNYKNDVDIESNFTISLQNISINTFEVEINNTINAIIDYNYFEME